MFSKSADKSDRPDQEYFIHLGLHKTATTALQEFLNKSSAALLKQDLRYIHLQRMRAEVTPLICHADKGRRRKLFDLLATFPNRRILLSDENILGNPGDLPAGVLYPYAKNRIEGFCEGADGRPVTLFVTLREPAAFITSMYCEYIRHNDFVSFDEFVAPFDVQGFSYARVFRWIKQLPRNVKAVFTPFETDLQGGPAVVTHRILEATVGTPGAIDMNVFPKKKSRSSYSREEIDLATEIASKAGAKMAQVFLNALDGRDKRFGTTKYSPISQDLEALLRDRYIAELAGFA